MGIPAAPNLLSRQKAIKTVGTHVPMGSASDCSQRVINDNEVWRKDERY